MVLRFATMASFSLAAAKRVDGGYIQDLSSEDYQKKIFKKYDWFNSVNKANEDMIGMCVFGDDQENPTLTSFDGEFEGLSPVGGVRKLTEYGHDSLNLRCNYESKFDDIPLP